MNDFENLSEKYVKTNEKPDKKYSILPTVLKMLSPIRGQTVLDIGCGKGFFTKEIENRNPERVYAIDNCQSELDRCVVGSKIEKIQLDIFSEQLPKGTLINAPFVLNYSRSVEELESLLLNCSSSLPRGKFIGVVDLPLKKKSTRVLERQKKYGAIKNLQEELKDGAQINIELYNNGNLLCTLHSTYFSTGTINKTLQKVGFKYVSWKHPIVNKEGLRKFGNDFWIDYYKYCELGYFIAGKD